MAVITVILLIAAFFIIFPVLNPVICSFMKGGIEAAGKKILNVSLLIDHITISLTKGTIVLTGLSLENPDGFNNPYALKVRRIKAVFSIKSFLSSKLNFKKIIIEFPEIFFEGLPGENNNLSIIKSGFRERVSASETGNSVSQNSEKKIKNIMIDHLMISGGKVFAAPSILRGQLITISIPVIDIRDIGKNADLTIAGVLDLVMDSLCSAVYSAIKENIKGMGIDVDRVKDTVREKAQKGLSLVRDYIRNRNM